MPGEEMMRQAAVLITGSEIISGLRQDVLVSPFARMLKAKGVEVREVRMIGDDPSMVLSSVEDMARSTNLVIVTGGLGDTPDDRSHTVIEELKLRFSSARIRYLDNPVGLARGVEVEIKGTRVIFMPGVPHEAKAMLEGVIKSLPDRGPDTTTVAVFGLRETEAANMLGDLANECSFLPKDMEIKILVPRGLETRVREILGRFALDGEDLCSSFASTMRSRGLTVACAESITGGLIAHLITQLPGSSEYFKGGIVAYSNDIKENVLGVPRETLAAHGAVSREVADSMLLGVLGTTGADVAMATTGIAGPSGGTKDKPVGTVWIAVGSTEQRQSRRFVFPFQRDGNKLVTAKVALFMLRSLVHDKDIHSNTLA